METTEKAVTAEVTEPKPKRKAKAVARSKMPKNPRRKVGTAKAARKMSHAYAMQPHIIKQRKLEDDMERLARILLTAAEPEVNKVQIAIRLGVNHGTVYRWTDARPGKKPFPIPLPTSALIVIKARDRIKKIGNVRIKRAAEALLASDNISKYLEEKL